MEEQMAEILYKIRAFAAMDRIHFEGLKDLCEKALAAYEAEKVNL